MISIVMDGLDVPEGVPIRVFDVPYSHCFSGYLKREWNNMSIDQTEAGGFRLADPAPWKPNHRRPRLPLHRRTAAASSSPSTNGGGIFLSIDERRQRLPPVCFYAVSRAKLLRIATASSSSSSPGAPHSPGSSPPAGLADSKPPPHTPTAPLSASRLLFLLLCRLFCLYNLLIYN
ncbi:unnamed protein product [Musa hybrid cultivar]